VAEGNDDIPIPTDSKIAVTPLSSMNKVRGGASRGQRRGKPLGNHTTLTEARHKNAPTACQKSRHSLLDCIEVKRVS
jgi:hypothetical protein